MLRKMGLFLVNQQGYTPESACRELVANGFPPEKADRFLEWHRAQAEAHDVMTPPPGCNVLRYRTEAETKPWDVGDQLDVDLFWPSLLPRLEQKVGSTAAMDISRAADHVRKNCADPRHHGHSRKGLVVGYVQSGKTANYTSLIAKAADAGYRGFIVLGGIHNALRRQTQLRLEQDLVRPSMIAAEGQNGAPRWQLLTTADSDFRFQPDGQGMLATRDLRLLAVVKKNASRLRRLRDWLQDMPLSTRRQWPALVLDDEADQATPNSGRPGQQATTINALLKEIMALLPTSTYVGYTATPFANVLIDPSADQDFYPRSFIVSLPKPDGYFGAEELFGRGALDDADDPVDGYDLIRTVPPEHQDAVRPPTRSEDRKNFVPPVPSSMADAIRWFLMATSARHARGHGRFHSSMLIHTTQYSLVHIAQADAIRDYLEKLGSRVGDPDTQAALRDMWESEMDAYIPDGAEPIPDFSELLRHLPSVLEDVRVIVDNSLSEDRLDYTETELVNGQEREVPQTVIAVGGNTLSRGLTLEGLCVSYFVRSASAYDTLLQMGRWFGYRPGYADLARVWMPDALAENFRFLASVEEEIRQEIHRYSRNGLTPKDVGVRIRRHPGMAITSRLRMQHAVTAEMSYAGKRRQTFLFAHKDAETLGNNLTATRRLLDTLGPAERPGPARWVFHDTPPTAVERFLSEYRFHPDQEDLDSDAIIAFLRKWEAAGHPVSWNVGIVGSARTNHTVEGQTVNLGTIDLGLDEPVGLVNRSAMRKVERHDRANIKALMSTRDQVIDLAELTPEQAGGRDAELRQLREEMAPMTGLLVLYPISRASVPLGRSEKRLATRQPLDAVDDVVGVGLVFPEAPSELAGTSLASEYVTVDLSRVEDEYYEQDEATWELAAEEPEEDAA